jgi:hypothetical protein
VSAGRALGASLRPILAGGLTVAAVILLGFLTRAPLAGRDADRAALVLTWRLRGEEVVVCRRPTEADLADLPVHMRNPDACVGDIPPFALDVIVNGEPLVSRAVRPAGVRGDRPLYVYEELWLEPGRHELTVSFRSQDGAGPGGATGALRLTTSVDLAPGQVLLVTRSAAGDLEVRAPER